MRWMQCTLRAGAGLALKRGCSRQTDINITDVEIKLKINKLLLNLESTSVKSDTAIHQVIHSNFSLTGFLYVYCTIKSHFKLGKEKKDT